MREATTTAARSMVTGVDFVTFATSDLDRARGFYRDVLGLREAVVRDPYNVEYDTGTVTLSVIDPVKMNIGEFHPNRNALALQVDDVPAARAMLESSGVAFHADTLDTGVCPMAFFQDPDGNELMLHHRYAPKEG